MKLEKREITLNEADSLRDMLYTEKTVLQAYVNAIDCPLRKQTQNELLDELKEVALQVCGLRALLHSTIKDENV